MKAKDLKVTMIRKLMQIGILLLPILFWVNLAKNLYHNIVITQYDTSAL